MESLPDTSNLLALCELYCKAIGLSESTISQRATKNPYYFSRLRARQGSTVKTYNRVLRWFSDHWPTDEPWPRDIPRPAPSGARQPQEAA